MSNLRRLRRKQNVSGLRISGKIFNRMANDHVDVLQNIEFALVSAYRDNEAIDDSVVAEALKISIVGGEAANELTALLVDDISGIREVRLDISDELWEKGLKVVLESVHNHSAIRRGDRSYLNFISEFL